MRYDKYRSYNNKDSVQLICKKFKLFADKGIEYSTLSDMQVKRLSTFLDWFPVDKNLSDWVPTLIHMIENDLTNYAGRCKRLMKLPASPSLYSFILRYGKRTGKKKYDDAYMKKISKFQNTYHFWKNSGFSEDEIKEKISEIQVERSKISSMKTRNTSLYTCRSMVYWTSRGYSDDFAREMVKSIQGRNHSDERNKKWLKTLNDKPLEEKLLINKKKGHSIECIMARGYSYEYAVNKAIETSKKRNCSSKISCEYFNAVSYGVENNNYFYGNKNCEYVIGNYYVDFYDRDSKTVIEFYGDFWHRNPNSYVEDFTCYGKTSREIWDYDKRRRDLLLLSGHVDNLYIVWESEYNSDKLRVVEDTILLLKEHGGING